MGRTLIQASMSHQDELLDAPCEALHDDRLAVRMTSRLRENKSVISFAFLSNGDTEK